MSDHGTHCPFLNRADSRCSYHFSLERLNHAFGYCFDQYQQCPAYLEMLVERRLRRMIGSFTDTGRSDESTPLVQITLHGRSGAAVADRHRQHAA
jgi:hypothetical protein